ncbi:MAG TPA: SPOR domain-containing protein [Rudaea sp.]|nr:SPOR domain-containing protein [Rudaea sp.]
MVEVRAIDPAHPEPPAPRAVSARASTPTPEKTHKPALYLQVGAYGDSANAGRAAARLRAARLGDVRVVTAQVNGKAVQRVRLGPLKDVDEADRLTPKVRELGLGEPRVAIDD